MSKSAPRSPKTASLLSRLSSEDFRLLRPHLAAVDLPLRRQLERPNKPIEHVYFFESGIASVVANGVGRQGIEAGIIGREGMSGLAVLMENDRSPNETYMQSAGSGQRIAVARLRPILGQSAGLRRSLLRYAHTFVLQIAYTALANGRSKIEERLARWLLMAHDRTDGDELSLTHEFLGLMLGVRRPGVTVAINLLVKRGLIKAHRGLITIMDREGLVAGANGAYGAPEAEFKRLFS
jgi:CRP-like cAMP-binding protein